MLSDVQPTKPTQSTTRNQNRKENPVPNAQKGVKNAGKGKSKGYYEPRITLNIFECFECYYKDLYMK